MNFQALSMGTATCRMVFHKAAPLASIPIRQERSCLTVFESHSSS